LGFLPRRIQSFTRTKTFGLAKDNGLGLCAGVMVVFFDIVIIINFKGCHVKNNLGLRWATVLSGFLFLGACGGGSGTSGQLRQDNTQTNADSAQTEDQAGSDLPAGSHFAATALVLPNPADHMPSCQGGVFVGPLTSMALKGQGPRALFAQYWCFDIQYPDNYEGMTPDSLVVYLPNSDGSYRIGNLELFGSQRVSLGGASRRSRVADLNGDGYLDIAFAINREDGRRISADASNWAAQLSVVLSLGNGQYRVGRMGTYVPHHNVGLAQYGAGQFEVFAAGPNAYRFANGGWSTLPRLPDLGSWSTIAMPVEPGETQTERFFDVGADHGMRLFKRENGTWVVKSEILYPVHKTIQAIHIRDTRPTQTFTYSIDGREYGFFAFPETCSLRLTPGKPRMVVSMLDAKRLPVTYQEPLNEEFILSENRLLGFSLEGDQIRPLPNFIPEQKSQLHQYWFDCRDINNDGYDDIVVSRTGNFPPVIYLNNRKGSFSEHMVQDMPMPSSGFNANTAISRLDDVDGDGIKDLIYHSNSPSSSRSTLSNRIMIHKGLKAIHLP
jgi:hypothetical protein